MQPERRRDRAYQATTARARMYLKAHLQWLDGFPDRQAEGNVYWQTMPSLQVHEPPLVSVDREKLRRTEFAFRKLIKKFPRALPRVVGDTTAWQQRIEFVLDQLKSAVHDGRELAALCGHRESPIPSTFAHYVHQITASHPRLSHLTHAMLWSYCANPRVAALRLQWLRKHAGQVNELCPLVSRQQQLSIPIFLADLAQAEGPDLVAPLLQMLSDGRYFGTPSHGFATYCEAWIQCLRKWKKDGARPEIPKQPGETLAVHLVEFTEWVVQQQDRKTRKRSLRLLGLLGLPEVVDMDAYAAAWKAVEASVTQALATCQATQRHRSLFRRMSQSYTMQMEKLVSLEKHDRRLPKLLRYVRWASELGNICDSLIRFLEKFPLRAGVGVVRAAIFCAVCESSSHAGNKRNLELFLDAWKHFTERHAGTDKLLKPWETHLRAWNGHGHQDSDPWHEDVYVFPRLRHWRVIADVVANLVDSETYNDQQHEAIYSLVKVTGNAEDATRYFADLSRNDFVAWFEDEFVADEVVRGAIRLESDACRFAELLPLLQKADGKSGGQYAEGLMRLDQLLEKAGWKGVVGQLLVADDTSDLLRLALRLDVLHQLNAVVAPPGREVDPRPPAWSSDYPEEFQVPLARLACVSPEPQRIADRLLRKEYPRRDSMERELSVIESKLREQPRSDPLLSRARNLRSRMEQQPVVSPVRRAFLREKLRTAVCRELVRHWSSEIEDTLQQSLQAVLDVNSVPARLTTDDNLQIICAVLELAPSFRRLGMRLIKSASEQNPRLLAQEEPNQQFLHRMRQLGMSPDAWLNPPTTWEMKGNNGRLVRLAFEDDPLEVLAMGRYFDTCLRPGEFNFFAAVANAIDINKRVLFARDVRGRTLGRCLMAWSDEGFLLNFRPYCHDPTLGFQDMVAQVAAEMARRMGTVNSVGGRVSDLVAPCWYDDGSIDLGLAVDGSRSAVPKILLESEPDQLIARLNESLAPRGITSETLPHILAISELEQRPEIARRVLALVEQYRERLPVETRLRAALLAEQCGYAELAAREIRVCGPTWLVRTAPFWAEDAMHSMRLLLKYAPSTALRVMRRTRSRRMSDEDETGQRREWLAKAHRALGRHRLAEELSYEVTQVPGTHHSSS